MDGNSPYPPGYGGSQGGGPPPSVSGYANAAQPPAPNAAAPVAPSRGKGVLVAAGVVVAILLGISALVLSLIALTHKSASPPVRETPEGAGQQLFVDDADKALCQVIGPLMREETERANAFLAMGEPNSPERKAAIPKFKSDTAEWASRLQTLLNDHARPPRYLTRTLQAYIDGMLLYSENMYADRPPDAYDNQTYDSAAIAYGGPLGTCYKVGVRW